MDKKHIKFIIDGLKSSSSTRVQESLTKIRNNVIVNDAGIKLFRDCGGLDYLLPHLRKPNEKILDITLSILGNCCLEEESSVLVGKLNVFNPLVSIIKTVSRDSIVGRASRVIGNLAQRTSNAEALHSHGAVVALVALVEGRDKNTSYPTLTMAVRAMRQLWMVTDKRDEMLTQNAVRCITILLTNECEAVGIIKSNNLTVTGEVVKKSQEELLIGILKCMGYFTTYSSKSCVEQLQGDGRGFQCLVALSKSYEPLALKCLMNLCYMSSCRPILGTAGFVECLVGILQKTSGVLHWPDGAAHTLAQLSGESVNRSRLRHAGGLPLLVAAAAEHSHALHALLQYVFDDTSFKILMSEGLIKLLTDELTKYLSTMEYEHDNMEDADMLSELAQNLQNVEENRPSNSGLMDNKNSLFKRRKQTHTSCNNQDELKVVIERDNMIVGFVDAVDSDASDDSLSDDNQSHRRKCFKRARSDSPKHTIKKPQLIKMASKDWSAGVYWEPKSPDCEWQRSQSTRFGNSMSPDHGDMSQRSQSTRFGNSMSPDHGDMSPMSLYSEPNQSELGSESSPKRSRWEWSPESGFSSGESSASPDRQWSPASSPHSHYSSMHDESSDSEMSGRYSPVCSEPEEPDEPDVSPVTAADLDAAAAVAHHLDDLIMDDDDDTQDEDYTIEDSVTKTELNTKSRIACILVLLFRVSHGVCNSYNSVFEETPNQTLELLTDKECLSALLDYVEKCRRPLGRAARILAKVLSNALCLMSTLKHRLALRLYNMSVKSKHPLTKCPQCKQLARLSTKLLSKMTILAESSYGIGVISYQLLKGGAYMKQTLSFTLPYIVKSEKSLKKYFIDCNALSLLFKTISEAKEDLHDCVIALSKLASNVHIKDPKILENRFTDEISISYDPILDNLSADDVVIFQLDDKSTVKANKLFLCQNSDVFCAMLMGCFKESAEKCVRLKNVTKPGLEYLLTLLHCGMNKSTCDVQVFPLSDKLETNLEVLLLADRFLFDKLKGLLSSAILQFKLTPDTADKIYVWSLCDGMGFLCVESVAYLLTGKLSDVQRTQSFRNILNMKYKDQWLDDIRNMIVRQLAK